jgi:acetoacetate decarboxylase
MNMTEPEVKERAFSMPLARPAYQPPGPYRFVDREFLIVTYRPDPDVIPHVDGTTQICELVRYLCEDITVKGTWEGSAALEPFHHALAPVAALPVLEMTSGVHIQSDLTLGLGLVRFMNTSPNEGRGEPIAWHVKDWHALTQLDNLCGR